MSIKPKDLNPNFLKKIEDKYGPTRPEDFFSDDLKIYYKANKPEERGEGGGITHSIIRLPSFVTLFKNLEDARDDAMELTKDKDLKNDPSYRQQASDIRDTYNNFRTWFRNNYPDQYDIAAGKVQETLKEMNISSATPGYNTPYAFGKSPISQYTSIGYKPVNQKSLRKKSKGIDYVDLNK